jgi:hypothetical protein
LGGEGQRHLQRRGVDDFGLERQVSHVARAGGKNRYVLGTNIVHSENPAREDFRQGADAAGADFLAAQLLHAGDVRLGYEIKRRPVGDGQNHLDVGASDRGTNGAASGRGKLGAVSERRLNRLDRLHDDELDLQAFLAEEAPFLGNEERHRSRTARRQSHADARESVAALGGG